MRSLRNFFALLLIGYLGIILFGSSSLSSPVTLAFLAFSILGLILTTFVIWVRNEAEDPAEHELGTGDRIETGKDEQDQSEQP